MYIEITEKKMDKLSGHIEESLKHMGKAMQCVESWMEESGMGERTNYRGGSYGNHGGYGNRYSGGGMNYRDDDDWEDEDEMMQERRRRNRRTGRYM